MKTSILTSSAVSVRPVSAQEAWQTELREGVRTTEELCERLDLPAELAATAARDAAGFPVFVPPSFLGRIRPGDPQDPLLLQVWPAPDELESAEGFVADPVDDAAAMLHPGVLQKYPGRALLITTGACAVHCRYCFRRHFPYQQAPHSEADWEVALEAVAADPSLQEVILSGGDPLLLVDAKLSRLVEQISAIPHVARLRVHTRLPVMIPVRVTSALVDVLAGSRLTSVLVLHANHAQELDTAVAHSLDRLRQAGVLLLNQAVLLRGVNDSVAAQIGLSERLIELGVLPYYLHQLDRVQGAAHFEVPIAEGTEIIAQLRRQLPGYAVPRYVQDQLGGSSKKILA